MKNIFYTFIFGFLIYSCSSTKQPNNQKGLSEKENVVATQSDTVRIANDSLEYEILIIEPGFNSFLVTQQPRGYYGITYLETRNRLYVNAYNQRVLQPQQYDPNLYMQQINYLPQIHYGYEVNYLLYNYFVFFERRFKQNLTGRARN